ARTRSSGSRPPEAALGAAGCALRGRPPAGLAVPPRCRPRGAVADVATRAAGPADAPALRAARVRRRALRARRRARRSLAAGGGAPTQNDCRQSEMQCSLSLSASSNALQVQQAVNDVNEGLRDPCAGAVENVHSMDISLVRIDTDPDTKELVLLFRVSRFHQEPSRR